MSIRSGPGSAIDGLVFEYDMGNTSKSWKGAPTTNLLGDPTHFDNTTYWVNYNNANLIAPTTLTTAPDGTYTAYAFSGKNVTDYHTVQQNYNFTAGLTYTTSVYVKAGSYTSVFIQFAPAAMGDWISCSYYFTDGSVSSPTYGTMTYVGNGWYRCSLTATATTSASSLGTAIYVRNAQYVGPNTVTPPELYLWKPQLEVSSFSTPFVNGTRSNTQALLDLTSNNVITTSNLTYNSNNTFSFNGSTNYITIPGKLVPDSVQEYTFSAWIKRSSGGGGADGRRFITESYYVANNNQWIVSLWIEGGESNPRLITSSPDLGAIASNTSIQQNIWYHVVYTYVRNTVGGINLYVNGVLDTTGNTTASNMLINGIYIGTYRAANDRWFSGSISQVQIYNRALTAAEIKQNFYAVRRRFGL